MLKLFIFVRLLYRKRIKNTKRMFRPTVCLFGACQRLLNVHVQTLPSFLRRSSDLQPHQLFGAPGCWFPGGLLIIGNIRLRSGPAARFPRHGVTSARLSAPQRAKLGRCDELSAKMWPADSPVGMRQGECDFNEVQQQQLRRLPIMFRRITWTSHDDSAKGFCGQTWYYIIYLNR